MQITPSLFLVRYLSRMGKRLIIGSFSIFALATHENRTFSIWKASFTLIRMITQTSQLESYSPVDGTVKVNFFKISLLYKKRCWNNDFIGNIIDLERYFKKELHNHRYQVCYFGDSLKSDIISADKYGWKCVYLLEELYREREDFSEGDRALLDCRGMSLHILVNTIDLGCPIIDTLRISSKSVWYFPLLSDVVYSRIIVRGTLNR